MLIGVILISTAALFGGRPGDEIIYSDIDKLFYEQQVKAFEIDSGDRLTILTHDNKTVTFALRDLGLFMSQFGDTIEQQFRDGIIL